MPAIQTSPFSDELLAALPPVARDHALHLESARLRGDAFAVIVWTAVLLEALLEDVLRRLNVPAEGRTGKDRPDLDGMIKAVAKAVDGDDAAKRQAAEIIDRAHSIRVARNLSVHNTGRTKAGLDNEAPKVLDDLRTILSWWETFFSPPDSDPKDTKLRVFLSKTNSSLPNHRGFISDLCLALRCRGIDVVYLELGQFDKRNPLEKAIKKINGCDVFICVGIERSHAYYVRDKEGTDGEYFATHRRYPSPWLHMEAAIAHTLGKPVFVLCERSIHSEGVFDREWNQFVVLEMEKLAIDDPEVQRVLGAIEDFTA